LANRSLNELLAKLKSQPRHPNPTVESRRASMEQIRERVAPDVRCEPLYAAGVRAEWIIPPEAASDRVVLYFHGGGYVIGSVNTHRAMIARIARAAKARALAIDYRLAPEHPFPAAVQDATESYRWLLSQGYVRRKVVIAGDSAGGGLTLALLTTLRRADDPMPAAAVILSPWLDLEGTGRSMISNVGKDQTIEGADLATMAKLYLGNADPTNPLASPLHADFHGFPPLLIQVGDAEVLLDDSIRVAHRAEGAGVKVDLEVWQEMVHVWQIYAKLLPEGQQAIDKIGNFIVAHTS
jgi:monoterpene epsilon-lactone hydrolase